MVVCHPGITEVAKSKLTMVCTERTRGVDNPANTSDKASNRCQCLAEPVHQKIKVVYFLPEPFSPIPDYSCKIRYQTCIPKQEGYCKVGTDRKYVPQQR